MPAPITFVHLTDLHVGNPEIEDSWLFSDTATKLRSLLRQIKALDPRPAFIVVTGDLTNKGDDRSYVELKRILAEEDVGIPMVFALGNHDTRAGFNRTMLGRDTDLDAPHHHAHVFEGVHVITLDTLNPGGIAGTISDEQFAWLAEELDRHGELPKLIAFHHPPAFEDEDVHPAMEWMTLPATDSARLRDMLGGRNILGILCGHIHFDRVSMWHGIPLVVGIGNHFAMDVAYLPRGQRMLAGSSFALGHIRKSGLTISFVAQTQDLSELNLMSNDQMLELMRTLDTKAELAE